MTEKTFELPPPLDAEVGAKLIEVSGTEEFGSVLLDTAAQIAGVDEIFGYLVVDGSEPKPIISRSVLAGASERVSKYIHHFYQHDPAVREISRTKTGDSFVQRIKLSDIGPYDYREQCFAKPGFKEKMSFGWRGTGYLLVVSFYCAGTSDLAALTKLSSLANLTLAMMVKRHAPIDRAGFIETIKRRLKRSYPALTLRENEVCARSIAGQSAIQIAAELGLSKGTVLTYRQRAYDRYELNKASDFLPAVLD